MTKTNELLKYNCGCTFSEHDLTICFRCGGVLSTKNTRVPAKLSEEKIAQVILQAWNNMHPLNNIHGCLAKTVINAYNSGELLEDDQ